MVSQRTEKEWVDRTDSCSVWVSLWLCPLTKWTTVHTSTPTHTNSWSHCHIVWIKVQIGPCGEEGRQKHLNSEKIFDFLTDGIQANDPFLLDVTMLRSSQCSSWDADRSTLPAVICFSQCHSKSIYKEVSKRTPCSHVFSHFPFVWSQLCSSSQAHSDCA